MIESTVRKNLLIIARTYGKAAGLTLNQISKRAYGNASFMRDFEAGKQSVSLSKLDEMLKWFADDWPENAELPYISAVHMRVK